MAGCGWMIERLIVKLFLKEVRLLDGRCFLFSEDRLSATGPEEEDSEQR